MRPTLHVYRAIHSSKSVTEGDSWYATQVHDSSSFSSLKKFLSEYYYGSPWSTIFSATGASQKKLGDPCEKSLDCINVNNSICVEEECRCQMEYHAVAVEVNVDNEMKVENVCRLAPGYKEPCQRDSNVLCRFPFVCSEEAICDCPPGFLSNSMHCIRNCKTGYTIIGSPELSGGGKCLPIREVGERCLFNEQCTIRYSRCLQNKCQCISGTVQRHKQCLTVKQCPIGDAPLENGHPLVCDRYTLKCPDGNYCQFAEFNDHRGFCCPVLKMNCPVGTPLSYGCENCPWDTHHCFTYTIGGLHKQNMCCPNDCPRSQPIRYQDRCYPLVGQGAHCLVDQQCSSVQNSICATGLNEVEKICQCPMDFALVAGRCIRKSRLGGDCETNDECLPDSNTVCQDGVCRCSPGFIPEPSITTIFNDTSDFSVEHCISEPSCPSTKGLEKLGPDYEDCSNDNYRCSEGKYCRRWHVDSVKQRQYSVCCPIPKLRDYEEICEKFGMSLLLENAIRNEAAQPKRCLLSIQTKVEELKSLEPLPDATCLSDSTCVYNPYTINEGICCKYQTLVTKPYFQTENPLYSFCHSVFIRQ